MLYNELASQLERNWGAFELGRASSIHDLFNSLEASVEYLHKELNDPTVDCRDGSWSMDDASWGMVWDMIGEENYEFSA